MNICNYDILLILDLYVRLFYLPSLSGLYFRLYIILKGKVSIYVVQDKENDQEIRQHVEKVMAKQKLEKKLDRAQLGQHVWTSSKY